MNHAPLATFSMAIKNRSNVPFRGWVRTTSDAPWLRPGGAYYLGGEDTILVVAHSLGAGVGYAVDVRLGLAGGKEADLDSLPASTFDYSAGDIPPEWFGGQPEIGDVMQVASLQIDGASFASTFAIQRGQFQVALNCRWYPGEAWVNAELSITNVSQELTATWGAPEIKFGDGAMVPVRPIEAGTRVAPGQTLRARCSFYWTRHATTAESRDSAFVAINRLVTGTGIQSPAPGMPWFPPMESQ